MQKASQQLRQQLERRKQKVKEFRGQFTRIQHTAEKCRFQSRFSQTEVWKCVTRKIPNLQNREKERAHLILPHRGTVLPCVHCFYRMPSGKVVRTYADLKAVATDRSQWGDVQCVRRIAGC